MAQSSSQQKTSLDSGSSLREEILGKIFESIDDKHKTHDELMYGIDAMKVSNTSTVQ